MITPARQPIGRNTVDSTCTCITRLSRPSTMHDCGPCMQGGRIIQGHLTSSNIPGSQLQWSCGTGHRLIRVVALTGFTLPRNLHVHVSKPMAQGTVLNVVPLYMYKMLFLSGVNSAE